LILGSCENVIRGTCDNGFTWGLDLDDGHMIINGAGKVTECSVPNATLVTSVTFNYGVSVLGTYLFKEWTNLSDILLPNSLLEIENNAFRSCTSLKELFIPAGVRVIDGGAFWNCTSIKSFSVDKINMNFVAKEDVLFKGNGKEIVRYPPGNLRTKYSLPYGIEKIGTSAFQGSSFLQDVYIQSGVKHIDTLAFRHCDHLKSISLPSTVSKIGSYAFMGCTSLEKVTYFGQKNPADPAGKQFFDDCPSLKTVCVRPDYVSGSFCNISSFSKCAVEDSGYTLSPSFVLMMFISMTLFFIFH